MVNELILAEQSLDPILVKARSHANNGDVLEAQRLYQVVLQTKKEKIQKELTALKKSQQNNALQSPPQEALNQLEYLYNQKQFEVVVEQAKILTLEYPQAFVIWNLLGASAFQINMKDEAIEAYKKALLLNPNYADTYSNMGTVLQDQGKLEAAIEAYNKAIALKPDYAVAYNNKGNAFKDQGKLDEAIEMYNKVISLNPNYADAYSNLGAALQDQGKLNEAIVAHKKTILLNPNHAEAYRNMAVTFKDLGKLEEAIELFNKAITLKPDYAEAHQNLGYALIDSGRIKEGLDQYEWRWKTKQFLPYQRHFLQPLWNGKQSLSGKRILLWCEQGIGDTINWSSCLPLISSQAEHCILECQEKLVPLLQRSFPNVEIKAANRSLDSQRDDFDFHLPMGSLYKHFFQEVLKNIKPKAFLVPDPARVKFWKERLKSLGKGPYIGISWKSSVVSPYRLQHYPPISDWSPVIKIPDVTFVNLQYVDFEDDLSKIKDELGVTIHNFDDLDQHNNIDDVAALCAALDMVVSTKLTPPFISSAVGTLTKIANWRQSTYNNLLTNPTTSSYDMFERDIWEPWDNVFDLIGQEISKQKIERNNCKNKL